MIRANEHSVFVQLDDTTETVNRQRVIRAPGPLDESASQLGIRQDTPVKRKTKKGDCEERHVKKVILPRSQRVRNQETSKKLERPQNRMNPKLPSGRNRMSDSDTVQAVIDKIIEYDPEGNIFKVQWYGYSVDSRTFEPPGHLPYSKMVQYFRRKRENFPCHIHELKSNN